MSDLTKRLRKWQYEYEITDFGDAADRIDALEEVLRELIDKGDTFGGELRAIKREDERAAWDKARAMLEAHD